MRCLWLDSIRFGWVALLFLGLGSTALVAASHREIKATSLQINSDSSGLTIVGTMFGGLMPSENNRGLSVTAAYVGAMTIATTVPADGLSVAILDPTETLSSDVLEVKFVAGSGPYVYPNPLKMADANGVNYGYIFYKLTDNMPIEMRIYSLAGVEIYKAQFPSGSNGGQKVNKVPFTIASIGYDLPAGIYVVFLISNKDVVARGKIAVVR